MASGASELRLADTYLLKSLDTFDFDGLNGNARLVLIPCEGQDIMQFQNVDHIDDHIPLASANKSLLSMLDHCCMFRR